MSEERRQAARAVAGLAMTAIEREPSEDVKETWPRWWRRRRRAGRQNWSDEAELKGPWRDTRSANRPGWRERAAYLDNAQIFAVDYEVCPDCGLGWVEEPYTEPEYQRCGLAAAGLSALRREYPGLSWHTLGGHFRESGPFWSAIGAGVEGGYAKLGICSHRITG
jgi:hypothetical protein